ncbi:MAG: hypothetical protein EPN33_05395 [Acidobacteria bacterium]|nr:MAG: hypothetical protein EPN33_05395 [Acidobacteriota bacterium]
MNLGALANPIATAITTPTAAARHDKLDKSCKEFAGILIDTMWSEFQNDPLAPQPGEFSDPGADNLKGLGLQAMSGALAERGGMGLAKLIEHQLEPPSPLKLLSQKELSSLKSNAAAADKLVVAKPSFALKMETPR